MILANRKMAGGRPPRYRNAPASNKFPMLHLRNAKLYRGTRDLERNAQALRRRAYPLCSLQDCSVDVNQKRTTNPVNESPKGGVRYQSYRIHSLRSLGIPWRCQVSTSRGKEDGAPKLTVHSGCFPSTTLIHSSFASFISVPDSLCSSNRRIAVNGDEGGASGIKRTSRDLLIAAMQ